MVIGYFLLLLLPLLLEGGRREGEDSLPSLRRCQLCTSVPCLNVFAVIDINLIKLFDQEKRRGTLLIYNERKRAA